MQHQKEDKNLLAAAQHNTSYVVEEFTVAGQVCKLICLKGKFVVPKTLEKHILQWYHMQLCRPGETRNQQTICQYFTWGRLSKIVKNVCALCPTCQRTKTITVKYGELPAKKAEATPWDTLYINLIGP